MTFNQFSYYASNDASAPVLTGQVGSLLNLLNAILVNGYGTKSPAGWTKPFSDTTNIGCFKQGGGAQLGLVVIDNAPLSATDARLTGYEQLTAYNAGAQSFPPSSYTFARKSATSDGTARPWRCYADNATMHLFIQTGDTNSGGLVYWEYVHFGDILSYNTKPDPYRVLLLSKVTENNSSYTATVGDITTYVNVLTNGHWMPRPSSGFGWPINVGKHGDLARSGAQSLNGIVQFPNGPDGSIYISPIWIHEPASGTIRGRLRGLWHFCHSPTNVTDGDTFSGTGDYAGRSFMLIKPTANVCTFCIEVSATVEAN